MKIKKLDYKICPLTCKINYISILPSNNFWTHTRERERESYSRQAHAKKEGEGTAGEAQNQPLTHGLTVVLEARHCCHPKLVIIRSLLSLPPCSSSPPPLDLVAATSRSIPLIKSLFLSQSTSLFPSVSHSFFLPLSVSPSLRV